MKDISVTISHFLACLLVAIGGRALAVPVLSVRTPNLSNGMYAYGTQVVAEFVAEGTDKPLFWEPDLSAPSKNAIVDAAAYISDVIKPLPIGWQ